jgi:thiosulfate/3-mercaptopyruvate sulfurtransferase
MSPIISAEELKLILSKSDVVIFDVSNDKQAETNYLAEHIHGAVYVDLNSCLSDVRPDVALGGRHPLPDLTTFANTLKHLGITPKAHLVLYDNHAGANAAARFWWMLKSVGHERVQVLNGGLKWAKSAGIPLESGKNNTIEVSTEYPVDAWKLPLLTMTSIEEILNNPDYLIVDVRAKDRFAGLIEPLDPRAGHIPGAINIPFEENLDAEGLFLKAEDLREKYRKYFQAVNEDHVIVHCGSGVTACHTLLALDYAGFRLPSLYVGSWSEWCRNH